MVTADAQYASGTSTLTVRPNSSLSWRATKLVILFFTVCLAAVAYHFHSLGAWLVLPFLGLELLIIGSCLYLNCLRNHRHQVIHIDARNIHIKAGQRGQNHSCFPRAWSKIVQTHDPRGWYPSRLFIGSHGEYIEVGKYLVESERSLLADHLRGAIQGASV